MQSYIGGGELSHRDTHRPTDIIGGIERDTERGGVGGKGVRGGLQRICTLYCKLVLWKACRHGPGASNSPGACSVSHKQEGRGDQRRLFRHKRGKCDDGGGGGWKGLFK